LIIYFLNLKQLKNKIYKGFKTNFTKYFLVELTTFIILFILKIIFEYFDKINLENIKNNFI